MKRPDGKRGSRRCNSVVERRSRQSSTAPWRRFPSFLHDDRSLPDEMLRAPWRISLVRSRDDRIPVISLFFKKSPVFRHSNERHNSRFLNVIKHIPGSFSFQKESFSIGFPDLRTDETKPDLGMYVRQRHTNGWASGSSTEFGRGSFGPAHGGIVAFLQKNGV